jgi:hypothetical protein
MRIFHANLIVGFAFKVCGKYYDEEEDESEKSESEKSESETEQSDTESIDSRPESLDPVRFYRTVSRLWGEEYDTSHEEYEYLDDFILFLSENFAVNGATIQHIYPSGDPDPDHFIFGYQIARGPIFRHSYSECNYNDNNNTITDLKLMEAVMKKAEEMKEFFIKNNLMRFSMFEEPRTFFGLEW